MYMFMIMFMLHLLRSKRYGETLFYRPLQALCIYLATCHMFMCNQKRDIIFMHMFVYVCVARKARSLH